MPGSAQRATLAVFDTRTEQEIVVDTATGGRTTYRNASTTRYVAASRRVGGRLGDEVVAACQLHVAIDATFDDAVRGREPHRGVPAGSRLPGVPPQQALCRRALDAFRRPGIHRGAEAQYVGRIYVNDRNTAFAPAYTVANAWVGWSRSIGAATVSRYARVNNVADAAT